MRSRALALLVILPLALHTAGFWSYVVREASRPYQLDYGEGIVLYQASKIGDPDVAYKPITRYPFVIFHYPPVYHLAVLTLSRLTGNFLVAGRAVSVVSGLLTAATIGLLIFCCLPRRSDLRRRVTAASFAGLLPSLLVVMTWSSFARVDTLALLLGFAGLAVFVLADRRRSWQYAAMACFVVAAFTKQTTIAAAAACLITAALADWRHAIRLTAFACALGGLVLAGLVVATSGEVLRHWFLYNQNTFSVRRMVEGFTENVLLALPAVTLACTYIGLIWNDIARVRRSRRWRRVRAWIVGTRQRRLGLVASIMLMVAVLVALTYGKTGSNFNYFLEWNLVCCVLAGLVVWRCWDRGWLVPLLLFHSPVLPALILVLGLPFGIPSLLPATPEALRSVATRAQAQRDLVDLVRNARRPVFSEDMWLLLEAGKDIPAEPAIIRELATSGWWDETLFTRLIQDQAFEFVVTHGLERRQFYTPAVAAAIEESYVETRRIAHYEVYEPRRLH